MCDNFLGHRIWPNHKLLSKDSVTQAKRKITNFIKHVEDKNLWKFLASLVGACAIDQYQQPFYMNGESP